MSYDSTTAATEHYVEREFDAFGPDGKRIPGVEAVTLRARAVREREQRHATGGNEEKAKS